MRSAVVALVGLALLLLPSTIPTRAATGPTDAGARLLADFTRGPSQTKEIARFVVNARNLYAALGPTTSLELPVDPLTYVHVHLQSYQIMRPGDDKILYLDDAGKVLRTEQILAKAYLGRVQETGERAEFTIAPEGVYGTLHYHGVEVWYAPQSWSDGVSNEVAATDDGRLPTDQDPVWPAPNPATLPGPGLGDAQPATACATSHTIIVQPAAEPSFRAWTSDWANRMMNAYLYAADMWSCDVSWAINLANWWALGSDMHADTSKECTGSPSTDLGLYQFMPFVSFMGETHVNAYGLWHGADGVPDLSGCANTGCDSSTTNGCLQGYYDPLTKSSAVHAVEAVDLYTTDVYDPSDPSQLGKAAAHELTHNAGEAGHPTNGDCVLWDTYNLMIGQTSPSCRGLWRTSGTIQGLNTYGGPKVL